MLQVFAEISVKFSNAYNISMLLGYHTDDVTRSKYKGTGHETVRRTECKE